MLSPSYHQLRKFNLRGANGLLGTTLDVLCLSGLIPLIVPDSRHAGNVSSTTASNSSSTNTPLITTTSAPTTATSSLSFSTISLLVPVTSANHVIPNSTLSASSSSPKFGNVVGGMAAGLVALTALVIFGNFILGQLGRRTKYCQ